MVIALAQACKEAGVHDQREMHVTAIDLDTTAVHMAYVQLFLLHIPAVVLRGDRLRGERYDEWYTAAHMLALWEWKLRQDEHKVTAPRLAPAPAVEVADVEPLPVAATVAPSAPVAMQLTRFSSKVCTSQGFAPAFKWSVHRTARMARKSVWPRRGNNPFTCSLTS